MEKNQMSKDLEKIIKEGFLEKESRYLKQWRKRWFVLTATCLYTFKQRKQYDSPTELVPLKTITTIKSCDDQTHKQFTFTAHKEATTWEQAVTMRNNNGLVRLGKQWQN